VRLSLRALDRSLEDQEVNALMDGLLGLLRNEGVELRYR
jgi:phenylalanyl-tRNA synthetase beta chain